jgi:hypothetical protein
MARSPGRLQPFRGFAFSSGDCGPCAAFRCAQGQRVELGHAGLQLALPVTKTDFPIEFSRVVTGGNGLFRQIAEYPESADLQLSAVQDALKHLVLFACLGLQDFRRENLEARLHRITLS